MARNITKKNEVFKDHEYSFHSLLKVWMIVDTY